MIDATYMTQAYRAEVVALREGFIQARLACQRAKAERKRMEDAIHSVGRTSLNELYEDFVAASGPFIDLGSLDFIFSAGAGVGGAMTDFNRTTQSTYGRDDFGFSA